jgi:electron transfer flavoprotein beta subunit
MNIIVCIKQVPDVEGWVVVEKGVISVKALVPADVLSSLDLFAIDAALDLKAKTGGKVTLISLGKRSTEDSLRQGLAMGADETILLSDPVLEGLDSFSTALALAKAITRKPYGAVFCGHKADDTQSGLTPAYLAQLLGLPIVRNVVQMELQKDKLRLTRKLEKGNREIAECSFPALLTFEAGEKKPRHTTIKGVLRARNASIERLTAQELGLTPEDLTASVKVKVLNITPPKPKMKGLFVPDAKMSSADKMKAIMGGGLVQKKSNLLEGDPENIARQVTQFLKKEKLIQS